MKTWNSKINKNFIVVKDATDEVLAFAKKPANLNNNYTVVQENGMILISNRIKDQFDSIVKKSERLSHIIGTTDSIDSMRREANRLNSSHVANDVSQHWTTGEWNHTFAGLTVAEADALIGDPKDPNRGSFLQSEARAATTTKEDFVVADKELKKEFGATARSNQGAARFDAWGNRIA